MTRFFWRFVAGLLGLTALATLLLTTHLGLSILFGLSHSITGTRIQSSELQGSVIGPIRAQTLDIENAHQHIHLDNLTCRWRPWDIFSGHLSIADFSAEKATIELKASDSTSSHLTLPSQLTIDRAAIQHLTLRIPQRQQPIVMQQLQLSSALEKQNMQFKLQAMTNISNLKHIEGYLNGTPQQYNFQLKLSDSQSLMTLQGQGNRDSLTARILPGQLLGGHISGTLALHWRQGWQWQLDADMQQNRLSLIVPSWPDITKASVHSTGTWNQQQKQLHYQVSAQTHTLLIDSTGDWGQHTAIRWHVRGSDLNKINAALPGGEIDSQGQWDGKDTLGKFTATHFHAPNYTAKTLSVQWNAHWAPFYIRQAKATASEFEHYELAFHHLMLSAQGQSQQVTIDGKIDSDFPHWDLQHGTFSLTASPNKQHHWLGHWQSFTLMQGAHQWLLQGHPSIDISANAITQPKQCWQHQQQQLCLHWHWQGPKWQINLQGQNLPIAHWTHLRVPSLLLTSPHNSMTLQLSQYSRNPLQATGSVDIVGGRLRRSGWEHSMQLKKTHVQSTLTEENWQLDTDMTLANAGKLHLTSNLIRTPKLSWLQRPLTAQLNINTTNLPPLAHIDETRFAITQGQLIGQLDIAGNLNEPVFSGNLSLHNAHILVTALDRQLQAADAKIQLQRNQAQLAMQATTQGQPIQIKGQINLVTAKPRSLSLAANITGQNILLINKPEYVVYGKPNVQLTYKPGLLSVSGDVNIPKAIIKLTALHNAATLPADINVISTDPDKAGEDDQLALNLRLHSNDGIHLDTKLMKAAIHGELQIHKTGDDSTIHANGQLHIANGSIHLLGIVFRLNPKANIRYDGQALDNPQFDFNIARTIAHLHNMGMPKNKALQVGLTFSGTVNDPIILPFSNDPKLSNDDILSYFAFGRAANPNQSLNTAAILHALAELPKKSGHLDPKTRAILIQEAVGFSEFGVKRGISLSNIGVPVGAYEEAFVVGRYITPKIYLRYTRGLSSNYSVYQLRYTLSPHWSVQTESGTLGSGADVLYSFSTLQHLLKIFHKQTHHH